MFSILPGFIYKASGVNRPLRANEDRPQDNLNRTYCRDQINKVANAVREIINAIKKPDQPGVAVSGIVVTEKSKRLKKWNPRVRAIDMQEDGPA
ncbi:MAG: hypothetical protein NTV01_07310 [Bacteroidia bacterium]|nr:hypothetical protein [Bacteroidia bacterium]